MLLFKPEHVEPILEGRKTQTRRIWKAPRVRVGAVHQAKTRLFGGEPFALLRITARRQEHLMDITPADAVREGYRNVDDYWAAFMTINAKRIHDLDVMVWVVDFRLTSEEERSGGENRA